MNALVPVNAAPSMTVSDVERVANAIAKGGLFGSKDPYAVLTLCLVAQAEGQHPAVVFRDYHIINGKPAKKAEAMLRDFLSAGGKVEWHALTDELADATFAHPSGGTARISWDHARAVKAQIAGNAMYKKYPRQMLRSRVISEGVRTVYPGATSGLYESDEVRTFDDVKEPAHDSTTGEIIETIERKPVPGIHKIKGRLRKLMLDGNAANTLRDFKVLLEEYDPELKTIEEANHEFWTGDGVDSAGYKAWIDFRLKELAGTEDAESVEYQMLCSCVDECRTSAELQAFLNKHGDAIGTLDGEESRLFEERYDARVEALKSPTPVIAGQFGG